MEIDETSLTPLFIQVAQWLENEILKDHIREEEQVPSTNQFASLYHINPATARKGFTLLTDEGILYKKRGIGMFVSTGAKETIKKRRKAEFYDHYIRSIIKEAESLEISKEELVTMILENEDC